MAKFILAVILLPGILIISPPEVKVSGAMKNIMLKGDLSASMNLDTLDKTHVYGLGPVAGLKGEIMIVDGVVNSSSVTNGQLSNQQDKVSQAAMLVYCKVENWKTLNVKAAVTNYAELEKLVERIAGANGYDPETPFVFKIEGALSHTGYHVIDWKDGTEHTIDNHKQFAYSGTFSNKKMTMLGFYSDHHQSIFTHHTTNMHIHILEESSNTVGHLDGITINGTVIFYFPER